MTADFSNEGTDFSALYKDASAPKDADPADELFKQLSSANTPAVQAPAVVNDAGLAPRSAAAPTTTSPGAITATIPTANPTSTQNPAADQAALLARLAPLGVKSISELKSKSDIELRKLSTDAVGYEQRQRDLAKHFFKNPDGSWDFSKGPDGRATGLGPDGKVLPPAGTTPATPAATDTPPSGKAPTPKPSSPKPVAVKKPVVKARKPAVKARKPAAKPKAPVVKAKKPASTARKPVSKPKAPVVKAKPAARIVRRAS